MIKLLIPLFIYVVGMVILYMNPESALYKSIGFTLSGLATGVFLYLLAKKNKLINVAVNVCHGKTFGLD